METNVSFGDWLRRRRKALDLTQEALAEQIGCSTGLIRKIEGDERRPSRQIAELLAIVLQIPTSERDKFLKVARAQLRTERLASISAVTNALPQPGLAENPMPAPANLASQKPEVVAPVRKPPLPIPPTTLIGRERELVMLKQLLANPDCRLLTIVGAGGMGKTRLALAVAQARAATDDEMLPDQVPMPPFTDGVAFVALAALASADYMVSAIANALNFAFSGAAEPKSQLLNYLRGQQLLLVLDNFEHLLAGVDLLTDLLASCADIKLLVTSRERLNLQAEWVFDLQGLPTPPDRLALRTDVADQIQAEEALAHYSSVALFVKSAQRMQVQFVLSAENQASVAHICRLVDGMPLGIELAAAWVHLLSCQEIAEEIARSLDFLASTRHDVPTRHRSLRAIFDYSWQRLSAEERQVLGCLSVFRGGFTRAAAATIAGASLLLLSALVAKSLVQRREAGRYDLHELVRQYAASRLSEDQAAYQATRNRHAAWHLTFLQQREADLQSSRQQAVLAELTSEMDNLRLAWTWGAEQGHFAQLRGAAPAFWYLYALLGAVHEADALFLQSIKSVQAHVVTDAETRAVQQVTLGDLLSRGSWFRQSVSHPAESRAMLEQSINLLRQYDDRAALVHALLLLATMDLFQGALASAKEKAEECLHLSRALGQWWHVGICYGGFGLAAHAQGAYTEALTWFGEALQILRTVGDPRYIAFTLGNLSRTTVALGQFPATKKILEECRQLAYHTNDRFMMAHVQENLSLVAYATDNLAEAYQHVEESLHHYRTLLDQWGITRALNQLGQVSARIGNVDEAYRHYRAALQLAMETENLPNALNALAGLADLPIKGGAAEGRLALVLLVLHHPASSQESKARVKSLHDELTGQLTPEQIATAQAKSFDSLVAEILQR